MKSRPTVAVVGRPNVGKSTLVNRLVGRRAAVVAEQPGVTRDRKTFDCDWSGREFELIDTGGWEPAPGDTLAEAVCHQAELAIELSDVIVFVVDATVGVTDEDAAAASLLRRKGGPPVIVVANKVDTPGREAYAADFYKLGFSEVVPVSALHGHGSGELLDAIVSDLGEEIEGEDPTADGIPQIAIVGRPNAGKSTLFNRLVGEERSIVHETAGTTRDSVDTVVEVNGTTYRYIDTAGLRRKAKVDEAVEYYGNLRALESVDRADIALLVIDAAGGVSQQDQRLAERVVAGGCAVVVVLTKWDLLDEEAKVSVEDAVQERLHFLSYAPMVRVSGKTGRGVERILGEIDRVLEAYRSRIPTSALNQVVAEAVERHPAPMGRKGRRARVLYATQAAASPPTIVLFSTGRFDPSYISYLERRIREQLKVGPTPLKMRVRPRAPRGRSRRPQTKRGSRG